MKIFYLFLILTTVTISAAAQSLTDSTIRAEVMILGSYHMHNPGADVVNMEADDVLSERRQQEMKALVARLARFQPTMIALEIERNTARDTATQKEYLDYLAGDFDPGRWEGYQIGFRLARQLGHDQIYNIDEPGHFPFGEMMAYAEKHGQDAWIKAEIAAMREAVKKEEEKFSAWTLTEQMIELNRPEELARGHGRYVAGCQIGKEGDFPGADLLSDWYKRNARIFSNLYKITEGRTGERILVIFGAGHAHILRELVRYAPDFRLVEPNEYLRE